MAARPEVIKRSLKQRQMLHLINFGIENRFQHTGFINHFDLSYETTTENRIFMNQLYEHVRRSLKTLKPKEEFVIRMRLGMGMDKTNTLEEIGIELCVCRDRIRQIESAAYRKLGFYFRKNRLEHLNQDANTEVEFYVSERLNNGNK